MVVTGGWDGPTKAAVSKVTRLTIDAASTQLEATPLPSLMTGRVNHACGKYINTDGATVIWRS